MLNTTEERLDLLQHSKEDIKNAINSKLQSQDIIMPADTPLSEYDVYIKMIQGGEFARVNTIAELATIDNPRDGDLAVVYDKEHNSGFAGVYIYQNSSWNPVPNIYTATANKLIQGYTALGTSGPISGNIPNNGALNITPGTQDQSIPAGYTSGGTVQGDADLVTGNIKSGINIFGIAGKPSVVDTEDTNAVANDILNPKTAYVNGQKITGAMTTTYEQSGLTFNSFFTNNTGLNIVDIRIDLGLVLAGNRGGDYFYICRIVNNAIDTTNAIKIILTTDISNAREYKLQDIKFNKSVTDNKIIIFGDMATYSDSTQNKAWYGRNFIIEYDITNYTFTVLKTIAREYGWYCAPNQGNTNGWGNTQIIVIDDNMFYYGHSNLPMWSNDIWYRKMDIPKYICKWENNNVTIMSSFTRSSDPNSPYYNYTTSGSMCNKYYYVDYKDNTYLLYKFNSAYAFNLFKQGTDHQTNRITLIEDAYMLGNVLYDASGTAIHTFTELTASFYKLYINGYLYEFDTANRLVNIYEIDLTNYTLQLIKTVTSCAPNFTVDGYSIYNTPIIVTNSYICYAGIGTNANKYFSDYNQPSTTLKTITRDGITFYNISDANATADKVLSRSSFYTSSGKTNGSMPNNGQLNYTPSDSVQNIPAGYTSGGTIAAMDITQSQAYQDCLALTNTILS